MIETDFTPRVQNTSKTITWTYTSGDPSPISIVILNPTATVLNGGFSVDEYVNLSLEARIMCLLQWNFVLISR